ncbi:MAG TPA: heavy metal translocating P-type ATPase metal-binding domain-containing protein [Polyangiaceae bacterium]
MTAQVAARLCAHCGLPCEDEFCCEGCRAVHGLIVARDLGRYYELRGARGIPVNDARPERHDTKWLDEIEARQGASGPSRVDLDVQGLHCSACVWIIDTLFERRGGLRASINPSTGRLHAIVPVAFDLRAFVSDVEQLGYRLGPPRARPARRSSALLWRLGICVAIAMNTMIFAIAIYAGLDSGPLHRLFEALNLALATLAVAIGGGVFFASAWRGLRKRLLHLDVPIALGIGLAWAGSVASFVARRSSGVFVDTLDVFIALMLAGRFLQERLLEKNRLAILENDGAEGLLARRERDGRVETVRCTTLAPGNRIMVAAGDLVPVDARLASGRASFSLDWLDGESAPRSFSQGDVVPAGAFSATMSPTTLIVARDFTSSGLVELLRTPLSRSADASASTPWWDRLAQIYSVAVLALAAIGFAGWMIASHDLARALEVTTAVLVVTCPCAFGIATPLAGELALSGLRRAGLYVRTPTFLDRAAHVKTVVFDKTGTLTSGSLRVRSRGALASLDDEARSALRDLASATWHPKSVAVLSALGDAPRGFGLAVERPGLGVSLHRNGSEWRLGAPAWVAPGARANGDLAFGVDGRLVLAIATEEDPRADASREVRELGDSGFDVWLLSGDAQDRTTEIARAAGIERSRAIGACSAQEKASWVAAHDHGDLLMVGDGINDALAVERATCGGTPAIDRPFMAARSDFYFVTPGLRPIRLALAVARRVARVRTRNLGIALAYNVLSIGLAYAGVMSPLLCAVLMPASSLVTVLATVASLSPRSPVWKS